MDPLTRRGFLAGLGAGAAAAAFPRLARGGVPARRPNVVVILADDLGFADPGFQGGTDIPTPNLDALAAGGVRCTQGYVSCPVCSPTRAGLLTGRYPQRFGHEFNPPPETRGTDIGLPLGERTVAQLLRQAGYATGHVGKWHLGADPEFHPPQRGFTDWFGFLGGGHDYFRQAELPGSGEYLWPILRDGRPARFEGYLTDALSREAAAFVRRRSPGPFFLYLAYNAPHTPLQAPGERIRRFAAIADPRRRTYAAMVSALDDGVGLVLGALRDTGQERNTLVFFLGDNGGPTGINGASNGALRGAKGQVWEGGVRVPFVARWTGRLPAGRTLDEPVSSLDIAATALALAGAAAPAGAPLDGVDLLPHLEGRVCDRPHEDLFWRMGSQWAVRSGDWKLVQPHAETPAGLFDLAADPGERRDLAAAEPVRVRDLRARYDAWAAQMRPPRWRSAPRGGGGA